jgi:hypothetical protein
VPESAIFLPAGQQLPSTPAQAAAVGETTGGNSAQAQADSVATTGTPGTTDDGAIPAIESFPDVSEELVPLNGAQIAAVLSILENLRAGDLTPDAAETLMISAGMAAESARKVSGSVGDLPQQPSKVSASAMHARIAFARANAFDDSNLLTINLETGSYIPTNAMAENAKRALEIREKKPASQRGMTSVGIARARDLMNKRPLSEDTVRRMKAFFDRHEVDKQGDTWDEQGKGWQAWHGWGGDEGYSWSTAIVERLNKQADSKELRMASAEVRQTFAAIQPPEPEEWLDAVQNFRAKQNSRVDDIKRSIIGDRTIIEMSRKALDEEKPCPIETQDIEANLTNRKKAVEVAAYGPANPALENTEFWQAKAEQFKSTVDEAKTMRCGNCAAFNISSRMKACIASGVGSGAEEVEEAGELGYCEAFDFKCAALRTCDAWVVGGPITQELDFAKVGERGAIVKSDKAPKSDTPNPDPKGKGTAEGDASTTRGAEVSKDVEETLQKKADDFNERYKDKLGYGVTIGQLKSVYQRGLGAFTGSRSPAVTSAKQWAFARVNAYLYLVKNGRPQNAKYTTDNDLLPSKHPKSGK